MVGQGATGSVVADDGVSIKRNGSGIAVKLTIPTPEPGSYTYPPRNKFQPEGPTPAPGGVLPVGVRVQRPELCQGPCDGDDVGDTSAQGGAFNAGGHLVGGKTLNLVGRVNIGREPFTGSELVASRTAEVHLAVAPHGALQPEVMPDQISKPIGSPPYWWHAQWHTG